MGGNEVGSTGLGLVMYQGETECLGYVDFTGYKLR